MMPSALPLSPGLALRDGRERQEVDLRQHVQRLPDDDRHVLVVDGARAASVTGEVLRDRRQAAAAALLHALDVGRAHLADPARVAAEDAYALVAGAARARHVEHVEVRAEEHVHADGGKLLPDDAAHFLRLVGVERGADGHVAREWA